jgi:signal transduction histidine kinase/HAMP domain-containing protein
LSIKAFPFHPFAIMSIRTKLRVSAAITIGLALIVALTVFLSSRSMEEAARTDTFAVRVIEDVSDLNSLSYAYLLLKDKRPKVQWQLKHTSLGKALSEHIVESRGEEALLARLRSNHEQIKRLFDVVSARVEESRAADRNPASSYDELNEGVTAQLMARAEMMSNDASLLGREAGRHRDAVRQVSFILILASTLILIVSAAATAFFLAKNIGGSLSILEHGTQRIAAGDLGYRVPVAGTDEISRLSGAFNDMTARLEVSHSKLEAEIAERRQAQDALQRAHGELEQRVEERTRDLAAANASLAEGSRQLEATNRELESFSYSVSHDLRAPLRAIDGFSKMLEKDLEDKLEGETKRKFETIQRNAQQMGQLIDDLLAFSRLGRAPLEMRPVDMGSLATGVVDEQKSINPGRDLQITVDNVPEAWGDMGLLRQVFANLISNAIKFTKSRETAVIEVGGRTGDGEHVYYVKDNGVGFDMAYVDKLFGVFQRLHTTREFEGTGVGLAIVQRIVHRHGGRVWAEGRIGEGATLYFSLPERRQHEEQQQEQRPKQPD